MGHLRGIVVSALSCIGERGQGRATSVEGKGWARGEILLRTPHPFSPPAQASTSSLAGQVSLTAAQERNSKLYLFSGFFGGAHTVHISDADVERLKEVLRSSWCRLKDCGKGHGQC